MRLGMVGLGRMGGNMSIRLGRHGHDVVGHARGEESRRAAAASGTEVTDSLGALVSALQPPRAVWLMIPAGDPTEQTVAALGDLLEPGDLVVDGGNSNFTDSVRRAALLAERGVAFVDAGVSGGIWGLEEGYCLMLGGPAEAVDRLRPALDALAPEGGWAHVGPSGAGHFVKMVHNGIEYGLLQAYGEGFEILRSSVYDLDLRQVADVWRNGSVVRSWLLDLLAQALEKDPGLETVAGYVEDSGEGRWTVLTAMDQDVPAPVTALSLEGLPPPRFAIVGYSRRELSDDDFRKLAHDACMEFGRCRMDRQEWDTFAAALSYVQGDFMGAGALAPLRTKLEELDRERGTEGRRFYYAAVPPDTFDHVVTRLEEESMTGDARLVIEKPFGSDLESARELNAILSRGFDESQIFRIDHYLGKETVQNILVLRFANALFEPVWNRRYVDHVELTVAEDIGIEGRWRFYERTGAIRDMVQTHLFHVLTFLAMEPPVAFEPEDLRTEIVKVLRSMRPVRPEAVVLGQYEGYTEESDVDPASTVETFAALRVEIENWRWAGVPFFLRTGKRLSRRVAEAHVVFRDVPHEVFESIGAPEIPPNSLSLRIQPDEGISLSITVQRPGFGIELDVAALDLDFGQAFGGLELVEAYEHLLLEAMHGDQTMFVRQEAVERAWEVVEPLIDQAPSPRPYRGETWGPPEADALIAPRRWLTT